MHDCVKHMLFQEIVNIVSKSGTFYRKKPD